MFNQKEAIFLALVFTLLSLSCSGLKSDLPLLTTEMPLHLEEHLDDARIEDSEVLEDGFSPVEWDFSEPQPEWKAAKPVPTQWEAIKPVRVDDALRLPLTAANLAPPTPRSLGAIYIKLPDWKVTDWAFVEITARTRDPIFYVALEFNFTEEDSYSGRLPFYVQGDGVRPINDGTVQTYRLSLPPGMRKWKGPWTHLGISLTTIPGEEAAMLDILSVKVVPKEHIYTDAPAGVRVDKRKEAHRRTLYTHTPGRIEYRVRVPEAGRLDFGLGVLREEVPVTFRIVASQMQEQEVTLFEEVYANPREWAQRSVDLSTMAGKTVRIALEADAEQLGSVALWAAPTLSGARLTEKPNIIFYVIDGAGADHMSVYGHNRRTTPNLERLAAEGALFENVYSNATETDDSTPSFMTSLYTSAWRGLTRKWENLPGQAVTMAGHMHRAGYQTAVFTSNPYAGTASGLERDVDVFRDTYEDLLGAGSGFSESQHEDYWRWREEYPGEPYWVHFQTEDLHWVWSPKRVTPFAGLYVSPELRARYFTWDRQLVEVGGRTLAAAPNLAALAEAGIDPVMYAYTRLALCHEAMAHQDYQLGQLVERLKATGAWEDTLLIIASDHAGLYDNPKPWSAYDPMFRSAQTRIPLLFFWPGRIAGGQRFSKRVSMIDVLPTILDLLDLPMPEVMQGQSLAPLLLGVEGWEQRPVILDEFYVDRSGQLYGIIEVVDGRWGASLEIDPPQDPGVDRLPLSRRKSSLLLYDLWNDPFTHHSLHQERPDLVEKYTKFLREQFEANRTLSKLFTPSGRIALTPEQLEALRSLGYID